MNAKTEHVQLRVSPTEKAALKRRAAAAGMGVSAYLLARALPDSSGGIAELIDQLAGRAPSDRSYVLAALNDLLSSLAGSELADAVGEADLGALDPYLQNYVAAMVEQACYLRDVTAPPWTSEVAPLTEPRFATELKNLRAHLLRVSPVAFKRRNIFIDASIGDRV